MNKKVICSPLFLIFTLSSSFLFSTSYSWNTATAPSGGNWGTATNWIPNGIPTSGDTANINITVSTFNLTLDGTSRSIHTLNVTSPINATQAFNVSGQPLIVDNNGVIFFQAPTFRLDSSFSNNITGSTNLRIQLNGGDDRVVTLNMSGDLTIASGGALVLDLTNSQVTFSGTNAYSGNTTVNVGNVFSSNVTFTGDTSQLDGNVNCNGAFLGLVFNQSADSSFSGSINGFINTSIAKSGSGNLTLSGNFVSPNNITISSISGGSLKLTGATTAFTSDFTLLTNNASLIFDQDTDSSFAEFIQGTGTLTQQGSSNLTLSNDNSYSGITTISSGTLTFTGATDALGGVMVNNSAVIFNQSVDSSFGQTISGSGTLTQSGDINLTLAGNNTYGGATIISAGTLTFTGSTTGLGGNISNNSALVFNQGSNSTFSHTIFGSGTLAKSGAGNLTLTAANNYTGATTISAGSIILSGSSSALGNNSSLTLNGGNFTVATGAGAKTIGALNGSSGTIALNDNSLTITQSNNDTFAGIFTGTSSANIVKEGSEMLTLTGVSSSFLGDTTINAGTLAVNGTLNGQTTVNASGRLQGIGTLEVLRNLGTVSPGNSIGTLTVTGDFTMADPAALLEIEIDTSGLCDLVIVTGNADLDGYVHLLPNPGVYMEGQQFLILQAGSINDSFLGIVESFPQDFHFLRLGNDIYVVVNSSFIISPFIALLQGNAKLTYNYLFCTSSGDEALVTLQNTLLALPTLQALSDALVQLCPALYSSLPLLELQNNVHMAQVMNQKNRKYFCDCHDNDQNKYMEKEPWSYWMQPIGFYYNQKGVQNQYGFHNYTYGTAFGFLLPLPSKVLLDLALGYTHSDLKWNNNRGNARSNTIYFAPSFSLWFKPFCLSLIVQGDVDLYHVHRNIEFTGVNESPTSSFESYNILCGLDFSAKLEIPDPYYSNAPFYIEPEMQFYCMNFFQTRFVEENGGDLNLSVGHKYTIFIQPNLGLKITQEFQAQTVCFAPNIYIGYLANIPLNHSNYNSNMPGFNIPCASNFTVYGYHRVTNQLSLGAEFVVKECDNMLFSLGYNATMFSHIFTQGVNLKLSLEF